MMSKKSNIVNLWGHSHDVQDEELQHLYNLYPGLKRLLGKTYKLQNDRRFREHRVIGPDDVDISLGLFMAISRC